MYRVTLTNTFRPSATVSLVHDGSGYANVSTTEKKQVFRIYVVDDPDKPLTDEFMVATNADDTDDTDYEYSRTKLDDKSESSADWLFRLENPRQPRDCTPG